MKDDEISYLMVLCAHRGVYSPRELYSFLKLPPKRALYILNKLVRKGFYDYGVSLDTGWLTDEGVKYIEELFSVEVEQS